jgi:hypothetical protein
MESRITSAGKIRLFHRLLAAASVIFLAGTNPLALGHDQNNKPLRDGDLVIIAGDYVTFEGKYSVLIQDYLLMCAPASGLKVIQMGRGGKLGDHIQKWDVLSEQYRPEVVTISTSIGDGVFVTQNREHEEGHLKRFRTDLQQMVAKLKGSGVRTIVVGSPWIVDSDRFKEGDPAATNQIIGTYAAAAREIAEAEGVAFANVHELMLDVMAKAKAKYGRDYIFGNEYGLSPGPNGHLVMAYAFLKALGIDGEIGTITVDLQNDSATATAGHEIISVSDGTVNMESKRYPFCFHGDADKQTTRSIIEFFPFNEDLNRFVLTVKNSPGAKLRITWGKSSKVYSAAELGKGINLAAEFLENPFSEPFRKGDSRMQTQQGFERKTKRLADSMTEWRKLIPDLEEKYVRMESGIVERTKAEAEKSASVVVPVRHSIRIEKAAD